MKAFPSSILGLCLVVAVPSAFALDCAQKGSPVDQTICRDPQLRHLDSDLNTLYAAVRPQLTAKAATELRTQQRAWIADRDRHCATGEAACLQEKYSARVDQLAALDADAKVIDGKLDAINPVVLKGSWKADSVQDPEGSDAKHDASVRDSLSNAELPALGGTVTLSAGKMCVTPDTCRVMSWKRSTVGKLENGKALERVFALSSSAQILAGRTDGSAAPGYLLLPESNGAYRALFTLCGANATNCRNAAEVWTPAGASNNHR